MQKEHREGLKLNVLKSIVELSLFILAALMPILVSIVFDIKILDGSILIHDAPFLILAVTCIFPSRFYTKAYLFGLVGAASLGFLAELALYGWLWYDLAHYKGGGVNMLWAMVAYFLPIWMIPVMACGYIAGYLGGKE